MSASHRHSGAGQHSRAILTQTDDSGPQQIVAVSALASQNIGDAVRVQHFGLTSHAPKDSEGLVLMLGGGGDRAHVLGLEHPPSRPTGLPEGSTRLYDKAGNHVHIDGDTLRAQHSTQIVIKVGSSTITITGDTIKLEAANILLNGNVVING